MQMIADKAEALSLHSNVVHYPILFWTISVVSDAIFYFYRTTNAIFISKFLIGAGVFSAVVAALLALLDRLRGSSPAANLNKGHTAISVAATVIFAIDFFLRTEGYGTRLLGLHLKIPFVLSVLGWLAAILSAYLGWMAHIKLAREQMDAAGHQQIGPRHFWSSYRSNLRMASVALMASIWLSSGSMAPYGATLNTPLVQEPCQYLVNIDHPHHKAVLLMLEGEDKSQWAFSVVLRRVLFTVLAFPFMRLWSFEVGGFMASVLFHLISFHLFVAFLRSEIGIAASIGGMWLLATYPGISYWAALPYANAAIVPCTLLATILLWKLERAIVMRTAIVLSLLLGLLFTAYDLLPFFGVAAVIIVIAKRRYRQLPGVILALIIPSAVSNILLRIFFDVGLSNSNTDVYYYVIRSYLQRPDFPRWIALLTDLPRVIAENYFFSNFLFLPLLFLVFYLLDFFVGRRLKFTLTEKAIFVAVAAVFFFNNLAPPYPGWQLRGVYIARLYQPSFAALILFSVRMCQRSLLLPRTWKHGIMTLFVITVLANATIAFGPVIHNSFAGQIYYRFYRHASRDSLAINLTRYGRRPLGFCDH